MKKERVALMAGLFMAATDLFVPNPAWALDPRSGSSTIEPPAVVLTLDEVFQLLDINTDPDEEDTTGLVFTGCSEAVVHLRCVPLPEIGGGGPRVFCDLDDDLWLIVGGMSLEGRVEQGRLEGSPDPRGPSWATHGVDPTLFGSDWPTQ